MGNINEVITLGIGTPSSIPYFITLGLHRVFDGAALYVLEVDWNNDGDFGDASEDITTDALNVECRRGRDYASQLIGRATAGTLRATLLNTAGKYSSFNTGSPIAGNILPGRKVRLRTTFPNSATLWTGFLDRIDPNVAPGPFNTAMLYASGAFIKLSGRNSRVNPDAQSGVLTGTVIGKILDAADWPAGDRNIDAGNVEVGRWYVEEQEALAALVAIEDTEIGFVFEDLDWDITYEERYKRVVDNLTSQATFSDAAGAVRPYIAIKQDDPLREIFNEIEVTVQPYHTNVLAVLWTLTGVVPALIAGQSRTYIAQYPNDSSGGSVGAYVETWTTPVVGTDITQVGVANGDIAVSVTKRAKSMLITITNNHLTAAATLTLVQARGVAVVKDNPFRIRDSNAASQTPYGKRYYPNPSTWYSNTAFAEQAAAYILSRWKDPRPILSISIAANRDTVVMAEALTRAISDRVTVVAQNKAQLGVNRDFHIEAISHKIGPGGRYHQTTFELSPAETDPAYWILNVDVLNTGTKLAY